MKMKETKPSGDIRCWTPFFPGSQWRIQDFPEEGALTPKGAAPTYYLPSFSRKLHENEEILGQRGGACPSRPPLDPPLDRQILYYKLLTHQEIEFKECGGFSLYCLFVVFFPPTYELRREGDIFSLFTEEERVPMASGPLSLP